MAGPGRPAKKAQPKVTNEPVEATLVTASNPPKTEETPEQKRIRELEERLASLAEAAESRIRELEEKAKAAQAYVPVDKYDDKEGDTVLIHFVEDGLTAQGQLWYRGQEIEVTVGDKSWNDSLDRNGKSWMALTENEQIDRYGSVKFRRGPWPGKKSYREGEWTDPKSAPPESELEKADRLERERRRAAPRLPDVTEE